MIDSPKHSPNQTFDQTANSIGPGGGVFCAAGQLIRSENRVTS